MTHFEEALRQLLAKEIRFVLVGGLAAVVHGSSYITNDLDICYERTPENIRRVVSFLTSIHAKLRGAPDDLPFILDEKTFSLGMNFTFKTDLGDLDLLGEMAGVGTFKETFRLSEPLDFLGMKMSVLSLEGLVKAKKSAGRPKDLAHLKELEAIREKRKIT